MRTFSCFTTDARHAVPMLAFVLAKDEQRASDLALRELLDTPDSLTVELVEDGRTICILRRDGRSAFPVPAG